MREQRSFFPDDAASCPASDTFRPRVLRYVVLMALGLAVSWAGISVPAAPAKAQGFFESLGRLFSAKPRRQSPQRVAPPAPRRVWLGLPKLTFAYAHQAGRYKRYRYSHQTPYGYREHPYEHGFSFPLQLTHRVARPAPSANPATRPNIVRPGQVNRRYRGVRIGPDGVIRRF